jgi:hypothetical protein
LGEGGGDRTRRVQRYNILNICADRQMIQFRTRRDRKGEKRGKKGKKIIIGTGKWPKKGRKGATKGGR